MSPSPASLTNATRFSLRHLRSLRWAVGVGLSAMAAIGLVLLFLLTQATTNREMYERNYARLFGLNMVVAAFLLMVIGWITYRLIKRLRQGKFGSRLLVKLAAIFALAGFAPGVLIYVVSYQFVSRSIETWFDVKVEGALNAGINLGRVTLEALSTDLSGKARATASQLVDTPDVSAALQLERAQEQVGTSDMVLWSASGSLIAAAGQSRYSLNPERPSAQQFRNVRSQRVITWIDGLDDDVVPVPGAQASIKALVLVASSSLGLTGGTRFLQVSQVLPETFVSNALAVTAANREYQERALARDGLRRMYIGTLTLSLFLAVFGAVLLAVVLGNQIARPLLLLADGVSQVAAGDLTPKLSLQGRDELDGLTRSFAEMTQQLADARQSVQVSMKQVDESRANVQTILDNLTAGVMVLDANGVILSSNPSATRILRIPLATSAGQNLAHIKALEPFGTNVQAQFDSFFGARSQHNLDHWQQSFELGNAVAELTGRQADGAIILVARGAELPGEKRLLVFDDISEIVSAQRAQAWGEVARRLAHEIKNPLTPIQLSAERLEMKLSGKVPPHEQAILTKSVKTIVDQVDAMKRLVNEFRDYARLPAAKLKPFDLNLLISEVVQLYAEDTNQVLVTIELDPLAPPIIGDFQQLRQVLHNLLQNAQDATESAGSLSVGSGVTVQTQWLASSDSVRLSVLDSGNGFPEHILKRAFEPYVTTKVKGTGLGLAVVKKIADDHGARVDIANRVEDGRVIGAQVSLSFPTEQAAATEVTANNKRGE